MKTVQVFAGERMTEPRTVFVDERVLGSDAEGAHKVDGHSGVLIPGLIDCHVHLQDENSLFKMCA